MTTKRLKIFLFVIFIALAIYALVAFFVYGVNYHNVDIILILLVANLILNAVIDSVFNQKRRRLLNSTGFSGISLAEIKGLEDTKTFIFSKEGIISTGKFEFSSTGINSLSSKKSVLVLATYLAKLWNPFYANALKKLLDEPLKDISFQIMEKNDYGISATNKSGQKFMLGFYPYVHQYVSEDNDNKTIYLIKNNIFSAKFAMQEKMNEHSIRQIKQMDRLGNLVYVNSAPVNSNTASLPFDRAYTGLNIEEQKDIIRKLSKKAKTAIVTTNKRLLGIANYDFLITGKKKRNSRFVALGLNELHKIKDLFLLTKKAQNWESFALYILLLANIVACSLEIFIL